MHLKRGSPRQTLDMGPSPLACAPPWSVDGLVHASRETPNNRPRTTIELTIGGEKAVMLRRVLRPERKGGYKGFKGFLRVQQV